MSKRIENLCDHIDDTAREKDLFSFAQYDENASERRAYSNYSYWISTWRAFTKKRVAMALLAFLVCLLTFTLIQPYLPYQKNPTEIYLAKDTGRQDRNHRP